VRLLVFAPNWLGDAVMALPALSDLRVHLPEASIDVAARPPVAPLFTMVPTVNAVVTLDRHLDRLRRGQYEAALLLTNSFNTARVAWRAAIPERWGYRRDFRTLLLTKSVTPPTRVHQTEYYRHLVRALGLGDDSPLEPRIELTESHREAGAALLAEQGYSGRLPLVAVAPGSAAGGAKRWPASSFAALIDGLMNDGLRSVLIGAPADCAAAAEVVMAAQSSPAPLNLVGRTDLPTLAGVLAKCHSLVTNDSGAMHFAAALGLPVIAMFGPTREHETHPGGRHHAVLTHDVWCRPCMLKECPLTHRCMTGITVRDVLAATRARV
jgi:lipopolysaccharide heptosyltransferase II